MSKSSRFPIEGKLLKQLEAIIGKVAAGKVARVCKSADFIANCQSSDEVATFLENVLTNLEEREDVATKAWQWARKLFGEYDGMTPMLRGHLDDIVGEAYADAVIRAFARWEEVLALPEEAVALLLDAIDDQEKRKRVAAILYRYAVRMFTPSPSTPREGGVHISGGTLTIAGGVTGRDNIVIKR